MFRIHIAVLCASLITSAIASVAAADTPPAVEPGHVLILPKGKPVTVDTFIDKDGKPHGEATRATLTWDDAGITFAFDCTDSAIATGTAKERDSTKTWKDDSVGVLLDVGHTHSANAKPIALMLSVAGGLFDRRGNSSGYTCEGVTSSVETTDTGWRAVIRAPWTGLGTTPKAGDVWGLNFKRIDHEGAAYKNMKHLSWTPFVEHPEVIDRWGHIVFAPADANVGDTAAKARADIADRHAARYRDDLLPHAGHTAALPRGKDVTFEGFTLRSGESSAFPTRATLRWDAERLIVEFNCVDPALTTAHFERDDIKLWKDDCATLWLDPGHTHNTQGKLIMLQIGASGAFLDARDGDSKYNVEGAKTSASKTDEGWVGRIEVQWKALGVDAPKPGDVWGANLTRIDQPGEYKPDETEYSSWAPIKGSFVQLDRWGHIVFAAADAKAVDDQAAARIEQVHTARAKVIMGK